MSLELVDDLHQALALHALAVELQAFIEHAVGSIELVVQQLHFLAAVDVEG